MSRDTPTPEPNTRGESAMNMKKLLGTIALAALFAVPPVVHACNDPTGTGCGSQPKKIGDLIGRDLASESRSYASYGFEPVALRRELLYAFDEDEQGNLESMVFVVDVLVHRDDKYVSVLDVLEQNITNKPYVVVDNLDEINERIRDYIEQHGKDASMDHIRQLAGHTTCYGKREICNGEYLRNHRQGIIVHLAVANDSGGVDARAAQEQAEAPAANQTSSGRNNKNDNDWRKAIVATAVVGAAVVYAINRARQKRDAAAFGIVPKEKIFTPYLHMDERRDAYLGAQFRFRF